MELYIKEQLAELPEEIKIKEIRKIREVKKFINAEGLKKQMSMDIKELEMGI